MKLKNLCVDFSVKLWENHVITYENNGFPSCGADFRLSDGICKTEFSISEIYKFHLEDIITYIDLTLEGKLEKNVLLKFKIPKIKNKGAYIPLIFKIHADKICWELIYESGRKKESGAVRCVFGLCAEDLKLFKECLVCGMKKIDWENHGKIKYYEADISFDGSKWCYSAESLEKYLNAALKSFKLKRVFVNTAAFIEREVYDENAVYYPRGNKLILELENCVVMLEIFGEGLFKLKTAENKNVNFQKKYARLPEDEKNCFSDIRGAYKMSYENLSAKTAEVEKTYVWAYDVMGFECDEAEEGGGLPGAVNIGLSGGIVLRISGDEIIGFSVLIEK